MYRHILAATDGSELAARSVRRAAELARATGARLTAAHVGMPYAPPMYTGDFVPGTLMSPEDHEARVRQAADAVLQQARELAAESGVTIETAFISHEQPYEGLISLVDELDCDLVVMSSHGRRGLSAVLLGSETQKLLTHSMVDTLVIR